MTKEQHETVTAAFGLPPAVREIAAKAPLARYEHVDTWQAIAQSRRSINEDSRYAQFQYDRAASAITSLFVGDVRKRMAIERRERDDGVLMRFTCCALRYDQLLDLLYEAYQEGQSSMRSFNLQVKPE